MYGYTTAAQVLADALDRFGSLYVNEEGWEVWCIRDRSGAVYADDVASDHDAAWIAGRVAAQVA